MKKIYLTILLLNCCFLISYAQESAGQRPDSVTVFLQKSISILKENAINRDAIDWDLLDTKVKEKTQTALTYESAAEVFPFIFEYIDDHHGALKIGTRSFYWKKPFEYKNTIVKDALKKYPKVEAQLLDKHIGYLRIPGNNDFSGKHIDADALEIRKAIDGLKTKKIKAWIIDLRLNTGGSMYQMLAGLAPLLAEGKLGSFVNQHGKNDGSWVLKNGNIYLDTMQVSKLEPLGPQEKRLPIAVLISGMTASSGEVVAISTVGLPHSIIIGENSAGYTTANEGFKINHLAGLNLAVDYDADRNGKVYRSYVTPNIIINGGDNFEDYKTDLKIKAAINWFTSSKL